MMVDFLVVTFPPPHTHTKGNEVWWEGGGTWRSFTVIGKDSFGDFVYSWQNLVWKLKLQDKITESQVRQFSCPVHTNWCGNVSMQMCRCQAVSINMHPEWLYAGSILNLSQVLDQKVMSQESFWGCWLNIKNILQKKQSNTCYIYVFRYVYFAVFTVFSPVKM